MEIIFFIIAIILAALRNGNNNGWTRSSTWRRYDDFGMDNDGVLSDSSLVVLFVIVVIAFLISPIIGVLSIPVTLFAYRFFKKPVSDNGAEMRRKEALLKAKVFLLPYKDIWRNLTLSNKYCSLKLKLDGTTIVGIEKKQDPYQPYRTFKVTKTSVFDTNELWNLFCINFSHNKSYQGLLEDCNRFKASIYEDIITPKLPQERKLPDVKIDINNCSEAELTALPGISIVISKKIIKKREEIGGFKSVEEFLIFVRLKPNVTKQLEPRICVNKMKGSLRVKHNDERQIDL